MKKLQEDLNWYILELYFSDDERGPKYYLSTHIVNLIKTKNVISYTILEEKQHFNKLGSPPVERLFGGNKGSKPVIMNILIDDRLLENFISEIKEIASQGKANLFYSTTKLKTIIGDQESFKKFS